MLSFLNFYTGTKSAVQGGIPGMSTKQEKKGALVPPVPLCCLKTHTGLYAQVPELRAVWK